ncbi:MAG: bifunctional phosphoribosylaminoimidazolecarboxamide formyltransferase/IMP cyclohydrolase, partial [Balneolaceae bacterium]
MALKPLSSLPENPLKIHRALLSVSDKTGITELARALHKQGIELISTGGTANTLREAGLPVTDVSDITGFPECLDGRVKTLHPYIHGGLLARTSYEPDINEINNLGIKPIELVVTNLYPFSEIISKKEVTPAAATEYIDIGGPAMIRAAAKNFGHVCVLSNPGQYNMIADELKNNGHISFKTRRTFARQAFQLTAAYDTAICKYMTNMDQLDVPEQFNISLPKSGALRYGENPHQKAAVYGYQANFIECFHGKELSYNNYLDIDAALSLMSNFISGKPSAAIYKHTVPCGVASADNLLLAYKKAFSTDTLSPFGGIVIVNQKLDAATAKEIDTIFTEIILAPEFEPAALQQLQEKKNRRLVRIKQFPHAENEMEFKSVFGGLLAQHPDNEPLDESDFKIVTKRKPDNKEYRDL